jgi:hypothetical protein
MPERAKQARQRQKSDGGANRRMDGIVSPIRVKTHKAIKAVKTSHRHET